MNASRLARCLALLLTLTGAALLMFTASPAEAGQPDRPPVFIDNEDGKDDGIITLCAMEDPTGKDVWTTRNNVQVQVKAIDPDRDALSYYVVRGGDSNKIRVYNYVGFSAVNIIVRGPVDYESGKTSYDFILEVVDERHGRTARVPIHIMVLDMPEEKESMAFSLPPRFDDFDPTKPNDGLVRSIAKDAAVGTAVGKPVTATDPNGDRVEYSIVQPSSRSRTRKSPENFFNIDSATGQVTVARRLDRSARSSYTITIRVVDKPSRGRRSMWVYRPVRIDVLDGSPPAASAQGQQGVMEAPPADGSGATSNSDGSAADVAAPEATPAPTPTPRVSLSPTPTPWASLSPSKPGAPVGSNIGDTYFRITWTAPTEEGATPISSYDIQYKLSSEPDSAYADVLQETLGAGAAYDLIDKSWQPIAAATSYDVRVRARNMDGYGRGPWSDAGTIVTASAAQAATPATLPGKPAAPAELPGKPAAPIGSNIGETKFRITWTAPTKGASPISSYDIEYKLSSEPDSAYRPVMPAPSGIGTGYNLVNQPRQTIAAGTSYDVRVLARNAKGWGPWSDGSTIVTASPPQTATPAPTPAPTATATPTATPAPTPAQAASPAAAPQAATPTPESDGSADDAVEQEAVEDAPADDASDGADSTAATKPVPALPKRLGRPANVSAAAQGDGSILVSWEASANADPDYYSIRRRADGGKFKVIVRKIVDNGANDADSASGRIAYRDADGALNAGDAYTYGARAFHASIKRSKWTRGVSSE